jgi:flavodoxin
LEDVGGWKQIQAQNANKIFTKKYEEIKDEFKKLVDEVSWNEFVYSATYNFLPVIGETYYLYEKKDGSPFLSLIAPTEWNMKFLGATRLESNNKWIKI